MKQLIVAMVIAVGFSAAAWADTYRWVDDKGVIHFTDNPDRIPAKYLKRVREIPSAEPPSSPAQGSPPQQQQMPQPQKSAGPTLPGGLSEEAWRSRFTSLRTELKALQDGLPEKREALNQLRRKRLIYQRTQDRVGYNEQKEKIDRDEARITELQAQLTALEAEASRAGVPMGWRQ